MGLKDRGIMKWHAAAFLPEHSSMLRDLAKDYYRKAKPILDEDELEEFQRKICYAMEFKLPLKFTTWEDGFLWEYQGFVHRLDSIGQTVYLKLIKDGLMMKIKIKDIVGINVNS